MSHSPNKNQIEEEFREVAPFLSRFHPLAEKKGTLPKNYFETLPNQTLEQIKLLEAARTKIMSIKKEETTSPWWQQMFTPQYAIAASAFIAIFGWSLFHFNSSERNVNTLAQVGSEDVQEYLIAHADEIDESAVYALAENTSLEKIEKNQITLYLEENLSPEEIEEI